MAGRRSKESFRAFRTGDELAFRRATCRVEDLKADLDGITGRRQRLLEEPADVLVYGTSLALVLQAIREGGGVTGLETRMTQAHDCPSAKWTMG